MSMMQKLLSLTFVHNGQLMGSYTNVRCSTVDGCRKHLVPAVTPHVISRQLQRDMHYTLLTASLRFTDSYC